MPTPTSLSTKQALLTENVTFDDWHARLGHPHHRTVAKIIKDHHLPVSSPVKSSCSSCRLGKLAKLPFASVEHTSDAPFKIVHSDVWGPSPVTSYHGFQYFILFIDDFLGLHGFIF